MWQTEAFGFTSQTSQKTIYDVKTQTMNNWQQGKAVFRQIFICETYDWGNGIREMSGIKGSHVGIRDNYRDYLLVDLATGASVIADKSCMAELPHRDSDFPRRTNLFDDQRHKTLELCVSRKEYHQSSRLCLAKIRNGSNEYSVILMARCSPAFCVAVSPDCTTLMVWDFRPPTSRNLPTTPKRPRLAQ
jgi:hypothetical protein